jgi:NADH-quinone oxidoreductase subunit C
MQPRRDLTETLPPALAEKVPGAVTETLRSRGELYLKVRADLLQDLCRFLRDGKEWQFDFLALVSGVDWLGQSPRFEVVYHLRSTVHNYRLGLKVPVPDDTLTVPSLEPLWKSADWMEREVYDLYGVTFEGHPNLTRIMMSDDWEGHPYRKDYPLEGRNES